MRRLMLTVLLATSVAMPAMAQDQGGRERDRGAQNTSSDQGDDARAARRAQRAERSEGERPQRAERAERPDRVERAERPDRADGQRSQGSDRANWAARAEARQQAMQQQNNDQQGVRQRGFDPQGVRQRGFDPREGGRRGWGQRQSNDDGMAAAIERQQSARAIEQGRLQEQQRDARRDGRGRDDTLFGRVIDRTRAQVGQGAVEQDQSRRDTGHRYDQRHSRGDRRWSNHWRGDRNYDWRNYRNHNRSLFRQGNYWDPYGSRYRRFSIGFSLFPNYYQSNYWLNDPWMYRLPPAYGPYRWVRYYDDALLVNVYTGEVVDVEYSFFW